MTNPEPVWLPWSAREVRVGDVLSVVETKELLVVQQGRRPLNPIPQPSLFPGLPTTFLLGGHSPQEILTSLLAGGDDLTMGELEAAEWMHREDYAGPVFVPIGNGQMVPMTWPNISPFCIGAYLDWREMLGRSN
ncbi:hypothetical protein [Deinococcus sp. QL22]|uniref:hypothetical protein n=1 Tax=Deinococcus sp. QL22 TaxID=2939437 RepID=UPI002016EAE6|nr:hypothetical protein [Deinococcus sp. QL22]UQN10842.1 hypothetical protein M1R55_31615 [Deinococcus sp. QL22]